MDEVSAKKKKKLWMKFSIPSLPIRPIELVRATGGHSADFYFHWSPAFLFVLLEI